MAQVVEDSYNRLLQAMNRGEYPPASRLPGERDLAVRLGISRVTLRHALARLEVEGKVERSAQRGWFVTGQVVSEPPSILVSFTDMAHARGLRPTAQILEQKVRPASFEEADQLRIPPGAEVIDLRRLRAMDSQIICVDNTVLPLEKAQELAALDMTDQSLYERLETVCGIRIHRSAYTVHAEAATAETAGLLRVPVGYPVLVGSETAYTAEGRPVLVGVNRYRGDAYRFRADLYR
ncbi:MAG: GntR family transcriptional regulator [Propionicimonas sp.]|uniref:GntR family transcriptional regulator n=1 Tax=Propionicimonas sp. TaxID=1955623 RepID=UPI002B220523|nr:GntR family transcriptional regulator [Propionicimonas sp.]MEA4943047.1 GntR family transcriptional regulator [Propionicimonas sp.]MEA5055192.1 GntR family transcriptional regulator [Propionicimonas sp.]MEA5118205.1 GntR family transcriptional regulator [Propionicimonas sp.]